MVTIAKGILPRVLWIATMVVKDVFMIMIPIEAKIIKSLREMAERTCKVMDSNIRCLLNNNSFRCNSSSNSICQSRDLFRCHISSLKNFILNNNNTLSFRLCKILGINRIKVLCNVMDRHMYMETVRALFRFKDKLMFKDLKILDIMIVKIFSSIKVKEITNSKDIKEWEMLIFERVTRCIN